MGKISKLKKQIKNIIKKDDLFIPYYDSDSLDEKLLKLHTWCDITHDFILSQIKEDNYDEFFESMEWYSFKDIIKDEEWYLKKLYFTIEKLIEEVAPNLERIKILEGKKG